MRTQDAKALVSTGSGTAALLYLQLLIDDGTYSLPETAAAIGCAPAETQRALEILAGIGLVQLDDADRSSKTGSGVTPPCTMDEMSRSLAGDAVFKQLQDEVGHALGQFLSQPGLQSLYNMYYRIGLPAEVILTLVNHCISEYRKKFSNGRYPTMNFIERRAHAWSEAGIRTIEDAEAYLKAETEKNVSLNQLRQTLGIKDREPSPSEKKYMLSWLDMGFGIDEIGLAYDRTVLKTGKLAWKYMDSILSSWKQKNLFTVKSIEAFDAAPASKELSGGTGNHVIPAAVAAPPSPLSDAKSETQKLRDFIASMQQE